MVRTLRENVSAAVANGLCLQSFSVCEWVRWVDREEAGEGHRKLTFVGWGRQGTFVYGAIHHIHKRCRSRMHLDGSCRQRGFLHNLGPHKPDGSEDRRSGLLAPLFGRRKHDILGAHPVEAHDHTYTVG